MAIGGVYILVLSSYVDANLTRLKVMRMQGSKEMTEKQAARVFNALEPGVLYSPVSVAREFGMGVEQIRREFERRVQSNQMKKFAVGRPAVNPRLKSLFTIQTGDVTVRIKNFMYLKVKEPEEKE